MMKFIALAIAFVFFQFGTLAPSHAQDDRYFRSAMVHDTVKAIKKKRFKKKTIIVKRRTITTYAHTRPLKPRKTIWGGFRAEIQQAATNTATILSGRPSGCPARAWCGCWLGKHMGLDRRELWLARNWARLGTPTVASPGAVVVFARGRGGHVGKITAVAGNRIRVLSGNDGRMVRERWRTMAGVIAIRRI